MDFGKLKVGKTFITRREYYDNYCIKISDKPKEINAISFINTSNKLRLEYFQKYEYIEPVYCCFESCLMCIHFQVCVHVANNTGFGQNVQITDHHERALRCPLFLGYCNIDLEKICDICDKINQ